MKGIWKEDSGNTEALHAMQPRPYAVEAACAMVYYAAERTLMSMVLMVLGLMGLGFVVDRLDLILLMVPRTSRVSSHFIAFWTGSMLVLVGSFVLMFAIVHFASLERRFQREGCGIIGRGLTLGVVFSLFVALSGVAISILLMTVR